ncbi:hypothetical protein JG687_00001615 [Phytophthora cactorum]|uniref:Uncharacterized protein n=1 Tax=Phytophthora cactorum TaxID=29920 RepID=A0A8T1UWQ8_9STRA|nr:hypothetical protein JG687_00001615 [Phytophthora cactorum]
MDDVRSLITQKQNSVWMPRLCAFTFHPFWMVEVMQHTTFNCTNNAKNTLV